MGKLSTWVTLQWPAQGHAAGRWRDSQLQFRQRPAPQAQCNQELSPRQSQAKQAVVGKTWTELQPLAKATQAPMDGAQDNFTNF